MRPGSSKRGISAALFAVTVAMLPRPAEAASVGDDGLSPDALLHLRRGAEYFRRGAYAQAEVEFTRVEHFAPDWAPVQFNQGAAAEAQGKLDVAIERYTSYLPHAEDRQKQSLELRLDELQQRRDHSMQVWRQQRALAWSLIGVGALATGGGIGMLVAGSRMEDATSKRRMQTGGYILAGTGALMAGWLGTTYFRRAHKTKQAIRGLALAPGASRHGFAGSMSFRF